MYREFVHLKRDFQWCRSHFVNYRSMQKVEVCLLSALLPLSFPPSPPLPMFSSDEWRGLQDVRKQLREFCLRLGLNPDVSSDEV